MSKKRVLVTAGNTRVPIDQVSFIDNIFEGTTGTRIAEYFHRQGHIVWLLTSHPHLLGTARPTETITFSTYDGLEVIMEEAITHAGFDIVIHSADVSDYRVAGTYQRVGNTAEDGKRLAMVVEELDNTGKIGSNHPELWLRLTPTAKLIDKIRKDWGFKGTLVKFKLQVGMSDTELIRIASESLAKSKANFIVADTLEDLTAKAFIISAKSEKLANIVPVSREELPAALYQTVMR
jgi:phosphopantothenoylcysteine synthetase/decarboxylase